MKLRIAFLAAVALALSACSTYYSNSSYGNTGYSSSGTCYDCGVVQRIESYTGERRTSGVGAVTGAVVGAAIGSQVGGGDGKTAATVAGAVAGGYAGNAIEKNRNQTWYNLTVLMNDGRTLVVTQDSLNGIGEGSRVVMRGDRVELD